VTGSANGIGRAIALSLAREGCDVIVNDLPSQEERGLEVFQEIEDRTGFNCLGRCFENR
jgi:NAD(P)-dependent dehydrogenase (short-subunit alcohol dehydrogenase family)